MAIKGSEGYQASGRQVNQANFNKFVGLFALVICISNRRLTFQEGTTRFNSAISLPNNTGAIGSTVGGARLIQFQAKFIF